jgi:hypothetical protein
MIIKVEGLTAEQMKDMSERLEKAKQDVAKRSMGSAYLDFMSWKNLILIEMTYAVQNRMFDWLLKNELKKSIKKVNPNAELKYERKKTLEDYRE